MNTLPSLPYDPLAAALQSVATPAMTDIKIANSIQYIVDEADGCIYVEKQSEV